MTVALIGTMLLAMSFTSSTNTEEVIYVRTLEYFNAAYPSSLVITDGNAAVKTIELVPIRAKNQGENIIKISKEISELKKQGYVLISSNGGASDLVVVANYIFEKK